MLSLRDYQQDYIERIRAALGRYRSVLAQAPTGAGKTVLASYMLQGIANSGKRGFFICHRRELIDQTARTFNRIGLPHSFIANGYGYDQGQKVQICSIDTLKNRAHKIPPPDFCIWDECHHLGAAGWSKVRGLYSKSYHIGLSATPVRLDGRGLDDCFDALVHGPSVSWLIDNGYLAEYRLFSVPGVDLSGVHTRMGDYAKQEAEQAMSKSSITGDIVSHWRKHAENKLTIGFAVSVRHSLYIVDSFLRSGVQAAHLDGKTPKEERRKILQELARGNIKVVFNVGLFGEGFDVSANSGMDAAIGCVIDAAPTKSLGAWLQRCGRALRPQDDKAIILDHAGNAMRHGLPCDEREWTLEGRKKGERENEPTSSVRQCERCFFVFKTGNICPDCGHANKLKERKVKQVSGDLVELQKRTARKQERTKQGAAKTYNDLVELGIQRGYKKPHAWARHVYNSRRYKDYGTG